MDKALILDDELRAKLNWATESAEIREPNGRVVGYYLPDEVYNRMLVAWANDLVTEEELDQASRQTGGRTLAEIWKRLGRQ
jgi:hypothetical protein